MEEKQCPEGKEIIKDKKLCQNCGDVNLINAVKCKYCGAILKSNANSYESTINKIKNKKNEEFKSGKRLLLSVIGVLAFNLIFHFIIELLHNKMPSILGIIISLILIIALYNGSKIAKWLLVAQLIVAISLILNSYINYNNLTFEDELYSIINLISLLYVSGILLFSKKVSLFMYYQKNEISPR